MTGPGEPCWPCWVEAMRHQPETLALPGYVLFRPAMHFCPVEFLLKSQLIALWGFPL